VVVEKENEYLVWPKHELEMLRKRSPDCLQGRSVTFITADMTTPVAELASNYFDLAYCENVLNQIETESDLQEVQTAINEMSRVAKPGGWVIAVEPQIGAEFEETTHNVASRIVGHSVTIPMRISDPQDISSLFEAAGLVRSDLSNAPDWSYCYRKLPASNDSARSKQSSTILKLA